VMLCFVAFGRNNSQGLINNNNNIVQHQCRLGEHSVPTYMAFAYL